MSSHSEVELPDIAEILSGVLQRVPEEQRPLLVAVAERLAAERYRAWANESGDPSHEAQLLACADREEEIARRVESLHPESDSIQRDIVAKNPDLQEINRSLFAGRPLHQQFTLQARGERLGAATWRSFAKQAENPTTRETFLACAELEEESARVLESIVGEDG